MSQDCPGTSLLGSSGHQVTPVFRDVPGLSWNVPCGILRDTKSHQSLGMSQNYPGMSLVGSSGHQVTQHSGTSQDSLEMSLVGSSRHQVTPVFRDVLGLSWDVLCGIFRTPSDHSLHISLCLDYPGHPIMPGESWDM